MTKILVFLLLIIVSCWLITITAVAGKSEIATDDLGAKNPGILPSNPFYFLKEWQRALTKIFTFNPIKKVELELQYVNERAAEIKKLEEVAPQNFHAITKAVDNYEENIDQLKTQLQKVAATSQNSNVDKLVNNIVGASIKHQELFDGLKNKFENDVDLENKLEVGQKKINEIINTIQPAASTTIASNFVISTSTITTSTSQ